MTETAQIRCPACDTTLCVREGEDSPYEVVDTITGDVTEIHNDAHTCASVAHEWARDPSRPCAGCGNDVLAATTN